MNAQVSATGWPWIQKRPAWLADLDVRFASLYSRCVARLALRRSRFLTLLGALMFQRRRRHSAGAHLNLQLADMNAHINHDLALAVVATC